MPSDLNRLWTAILDALGGLVMPDWGMLVRDLLPVAVAVLVVGTAGFLVRAWLLAWRFDPGRLARRRRRAARRATQAANPVSAVVRPLALVPIGAGVAILGLLDWSTSSSGNPVLIVGGLGIALLGVGLAVRASERLAAPDLPAAASGTSGVDGAGIGGLGPHLGSFRTVLRQIPRPLRRLRWLGIAVLGVALGLVVIPAPPGEAPRPVANLPLLLVGLAVGLAVVARAVRDWEGLDRQG